MGEAVQLLCKHTNISVIWKDDFMPPLDDPMIEKAKRPTAIAINIDKSVELLQIYI